MGEPSPIWNVNQRNLIKNNLAPMPRIATQYNSNVQPVPDLSGVGNRARSWQMNNPRIQGPPQIFKTADSEYGFIHADGTKETFYKNNTYVESSKGTFTNFFDGGIRQDFGKGNIVQWLKDDGTADGEPYVNKVCPLPDNYKPYEPPSVQKIEK